MKTLAIAAVVGALACPATSFAQSANGPVTRSQVRADLVRLEQAGYSPSAGDNAHYPDDVLAAEASVPAPQTDAQYAADAMGGVAPGTYAAGTPMYARIRPAQPRCVGPQSFCDVYFGR